MKAMWARAFRAQASIILVSQNLLLTNQCLSSAVHIACSQEHWLYAVWLPFLHTLSRLVSAGAQGLLMGTQTLTEPENGHKLNVKRMKEKSSTCGSYRVLLTPLKGSGSHPMASCHWLHDDLSQQWFHSCQDSSVKGLLSLNKNTHSG